MKIQPFNVITAMYKEVEHYDIMPQLLAIYKKLKKDKRPVTVEEVKKFIISEARYLWWAKCEWEIIVTDWPCQNIEKKIDVYEQIMMNIDIVVDIFMKNAKITKK